MAIQQKPLTSPQFANQISPSTPASSVFPRLPTSTSQASISPTLSATSPRVQLVPHARTISFDGSLSDLERDILENTSFDALDLSSKDFDFEDIFTYDKPQKKLSRVVEVSTPTKERDWSSFSFSHYTAAVAVRSLVNRPKTGIGEMYLKNQQAARKH